HPPDALGGDRPGGRGLVDEAQADPLGQDAVAARGHRGEQAEMDDRRAKAAPQALLDVSAAFAVEARALAVGLAEGRLGLFARAAELDRLAVAGVVVEAGARA